MAHIVIDTIGQNAKNIPAKAAMVAGYDTGPSWLRWTPTDWGRFKRARKVHIDQEPGSRGTSPVSDVESGAKTIPDAIGDARIRKAKGLITTFYIEASRLAAAQAAVAAVAQGAVADAGLDSFVFYWVANWSLTEAEAIALLHGRIVAIQFASPTSNPDTVMPGSRLTLKQADCDLSVCIDTWMPSMSVKTVRPKRKLPRPHPKVAGAGAGVALTAAIVAFLHSAGVAHLSPLAESALSVLGALVTGTVTPSKGTGS